MNISRKPLAVLAATVVAVGLAAACSPAPGESGGPQTWTTAWSVPMQTPSEGFEPNWATDGFADQTVRQVVRATGGGTRARVTLSNLFGEDELRIAGGTIARTDRGAQVHADTTRPLKFAGADSVTVAPGAEVTSDASELRLAPFESATVTLYLADPTGPATFHAQGYASTYRASGDHVSDGAGTAFTEATHSWYYLSDLEVSGGPEDVETVVAFGDSITDGFGSDNDGDNRYPDVLAESLVGDGPERTVLNAGIGGNMILRDSKWYGESALRRFDRDVLGTPGVDTVIVLGGLNDIGFSEVDLPTYKPDADVSVDVGMLFAQVRRVVR
ncbi:MAG: SGNH/GDSL hydrolase family protein, partial [Nocardia sp.]|nr:SGNH/GDSL hydrolase family protein [Nocardia sp.]